jgi:type VI secretion system protein ImpG
VETLRVRATCINRDLPEKLPFGDPKGDFELEGRAGIGAIRCLRKPTKRVPPPQKRGGVWRLISHLSLNYLSIAEGLPEKELPAKEEAPAGEERVTQALTSLREILELYNVGDQQATRQRIAGLVGVRSRRVLRRLDPAVGGGFCRGIEITVDIDEAQFVGGGAFLFASVLDRFLALYAPVNSFCQLVAKSRQREGDLLRSPPRAAEAVLR